jgi:pyruvate dehydrogenase E2 component (dihydrolipoamide acetyltransferase)
MTIEINMPKLSDTMKEGTLIEWFVAVGDSIERGQVIAEVETDKATMEMEAFDPGVVESLRVAAGQTVPVGTLLATLNSVDGTTFVAKDQAVGEDVEEQPVSLKPPVAATPDFPVVVPPPLGKSDRPVISPAARKLAGELGLDLKSIQGSGPRGRIVLADVERAGPEEMPEPAYSRKVSVAANSSGKSVKIRRLVARKMEEAWRTIPHFYVTMPVDMTDVIRFRKDLGVTINDFVLTATAKALQEHPWVNATWNGEQGIELADINIAIAVATDRGLYNPVIHNCEKLSLKQISAKARELGQKAADKGRLKPQEMEGGTFTITNMGMLGVESFGAIITPPQAAVLSVGTVKGEIVVDEQGEPAVAPIMRLTLSADHRVLDGADAAEFLDTVKSYLEAPIMLVSE